MKFGSFSLAGHLYVADFRHALGKGADGRAPINAAPLMGPPGVVGRKVVIEHRLHLLDGFKPGAPSLDPEILVEQGAVEAFTDAGRATLSFVFECCVATPSNPLPRGPATANRARRLLRSAPGSDGGLCKASPVKEHIANR